MRILIVLGTDTGRQANVVPGFDGLIEAYYLFCDAGVDVAVAAPGGGSASEPAATGFDRGETIASQAIRRFKTDRRTRDVMNDLLDLASVCAGDFDAALCLGTLEDRTDILIAQLLGAAKTVALIGPSRGRTPAAPGNGLLMLGDSVDAPRLAAAALLGALGAR